jgi:hypothetical protein
MVSIDIFAETNPAFCSIVLFNFLSGYKRETNDGAPFPLLIFPLPILLSGDTSKTFEGTNRMTGFYRWLENNNEIILNLPERIEESFEYLKPAIEFGFSKELFSLSDNGLIGPIEQNIKNKYSHAIIDQLKYAARMGSWFGQINSIKTIYNCLGVAI